MKFYLAGIWALIVLLAPMPIALCWATYLDPPSVLRPSFGRRLLFTFTIWVVVQISAALALGACKLFRAEIVLVVYSLVAGICLLKPLRESIAVALRDSISLAKQPISITEATILWLSGFLIVAIFVRNMFVPISNFDSLAYHLPNMATWLQTGRFAMVDSSLLFQVNRYPYNWQAVTALFLMPFRNDIFVTIMTSYSLLVFWLAVYCLARYLRASRSSSLLAAFLASAFPLEIELVNSVQVDLAFAAFCLILVYATLLTVTTRQHNYTLIGLMAASVIAGCKLNGVMYVAVLFAWGGGVWLVLRRTSTTMGAWVPQGESTQFVQGDDDWAVAKIPRAAVWLGCLLCLWVGGFWYARNWWQVGNPLGYVPIAVGGMTLFRGEHIVSFAYLKGTSLAAVMRYTVLTDWQILLGQISLQFGLPFFFLVLAMVSSIRYFLRLPKGQEKIIYSSLMALLFLASYLYWTSPYSGASGSGDPAQWKMHPWIGWNLRFALFATGLLASIASLGMESVAAPVFAITVAVVVWAVSVFSIGDSALPGMPFYGKFIAVLSVGGMVNILVRRYSCALGAVRIYIVICLFVVGVILPYASAVRNAKFDAVYNGIPTVIDNNSSHGDAVGYISQIKIFPDLGRRLQRVLVDLKNKTSNYAEFCSFVRDNKVACIVVAKENDERTLEEEWVEKNDFILQKKFHLPQTGKMRTDDIVVYCR